MYILWILADVYTCVTQRPIQCYQDTEHHLHPRTFPLASSQSILTHFPWGKHPSYFLPSQMIFFPPLEFHVNTGCFPLCSTFFAQHDAFEIHPCRCLYPSFIRFHALVVFHCVDIPRTVYVLSYWWISGLFPVWGCRE